MEKAETFHTRALQQTEKSTNLWSFLQKMCILFWQTLFLPTKLLTERRGCGPRGRRPWPRRRATPPSSTRGAAGTCHGMRQTLQGSFSAVSKPNFTRKYALESSRRDLHNALLCTTLQSQFFVKILPKILLNFIKFRKFSCKFSEQKSQNFGKILAIF